MVKVRHPEGLPCDPDLLSQWFKDHAYVADSKTSPRDGSKYTHHSFSSGSSVTKDATDVDAKEPLKAEMSLIARFRASVARFLSAVAGCFN